MDGAASVVIGVILAITAWVLAVETKALLIGEGASPEVVAGVRQLAKEQPGIVHTNEVLTLHIGPEFILVNLSVDFDDELSAEQVEASIASLSKKIKADWPRVKKVFVEAESWTRFSGV